MGNGLDRGLPSIGYSELQTVATEKQSSSKIAWRPWRQSPWVSEVRVHKYPLMKPQPLNISLSGDRPSAISAAGICQRHEQRQI